MTRTDALAIVNAGRLVANASAYLVLSPSARIGVEQWRHDAGIVREALLELLQRHAKLFTDAERALDRFDAPSLKGRRS